MESSKYPFDQIDTTTTNGEMVGTGALVIRLRHDADGRLLSISAITSFDKVLTKRLEKLVDRSPTLQPALLEGETVYFTNITAISKLRLKRWSQFSFADELKSLINSDTPLDVAYVEQPPLYDGMTIESFEQEISQKVATIYTSTPRNSPNRERVELKITISKDGKIKEIELSDKSYKSDASEKFIESIITTITSMPNKWSAAKVYNTNVSCVVYINVSL
ncbi:MAG: hypothetical protein SNG27_10430 [Rikenellaceae bacterium]